MQNKRRSSTMVRGAGKGSSLVVLDPHSVENARTWSELWMSYRGFMFRGDQLLNLRSRLMQNMLHKMQDKYPLSESRIFGQVEQAIEKLIR